MPIPDLEILLPVHNEEDSIEAIIREIHAGLSARLAVFFPYVLMKQTVAMRMAGELGAMQEGFWWEFIARVHRRGRVIRELPVHHRLRLAGHTQVYAWRKLLGIFVKHLVAIFHVWNEIPA